MKIFGRERESLRIKKIAAARAVYVNADVQEVEIKFKTEDNEILTLIVPSRLLRNLIRDLHVCHIAINPPLMTGQYQSQWQGMDDDN